MFGWPFMLLYCLPTLWWLCSNDWLTAFIFSTNLLVGNHLIVYWLCSLNLVLVPFHLCPPSFFRVWPCLIGHFTHWGRGVMFLDLTQHLFFTVICSQEHSPRSSLKGSWCFFFSALQLLNHGRTRKRSLSGWGIGWWGAGRVCVSLLVLYCKCYTLR